MNATTLQDFYPGDQVQYGDQIVYIKFWSSKLRILTVSTLPYGGGQTYDIHVDRPGPAVKLEKRGNIFRMQFGHEMLPFSDYGEEARFWDTLELLVEVRNPADNLFYTWTKEQALAGLEDGTIDLFLASTGGPGLPFDTVFFGGYKVADASAGERLRAECLAALRKTQSS